MEKRFLLAIFLSTLVLAGWAYLFPPPEPPAEGISGQPTGGAPEALTVTQATASGQEMSTAGSAKPGDDQAGALEPESATLQPERQIRIESPYWRATFSNRGAVPVSWTIRKNHAGPRTEIRGDDGGELELIPQSQDILDQLGAPLELVTSDEQLNRLLRSSNYTISDPAEVITLGESDSRELIFSLQTADVQVRKKFTFHGDRFDVQYVVDAHRGGQPLELQTILGPNIGDQSVKATGSYITGPHVVADVLEKVQRIPAEKPPESPLSGPVSWVSLEDNYFALALVPKEPLSQVQFRTTTLPRIIDGSPVQKHYIATVTPVAVGQTQVMFVGPKDPDLLAELGKRVGRPSLEHLINYGFMSRIIKPIVDGVLLPVLLFLYKFIPNFGVVIILVTFVINMLFFPLKWKGSIKMKKAQAMQPQVKALQEKMKGVKKDDPQFKELQAEQIRLMKEANPLGGCLPMLVQLPVFWAFFVLLTISIDVRHAPFLSWINNLSAPDRLQLLGHEIHVLPILMCLSWMVSTFVMPQPVAPSSDPAQVTQQKIQKILMGVVMPVAFTIFFFWKAPSGLVLYWFFNNVIMSGQQLIINRLTPTPEVNTGPGPPTLKGKTSPKPSTTT